VRRAVACVVAMVVVGGLLAGCGSGADKAERVTLASLKIPRPTSQSSATPPTVRCKNPTASLHPPAVMPSPGAMPAGSFMAKIKHRGYLIAGVDQNTLLFAYFDPLTKNFEGFEIALLRQLSEAIFGNPNKVHFKAITTQERAKAVADGSVDIVADAFTITCYRRTLTDFSTVYYDAGQKILVPSNSTVSSVKDLGGKPVCATRGSTSMATLLKQVPKPNPYPVDQRTDCLVALQQGLVDAITSDDSILLGFKAQDPDTKIVGPSFAPDPYGMAISKKHRDFVRFVNGVLAQLRADGTWRAIYKHYLGPYTSSTPAPPKAQYDG
jgi:polar amino acid transport system substrate-binding protein